jgi:hypothetical protein
VTLTAPVGFMAPTSGLYLSSEGLEPSSFVPQIFCSCHARLYSTNDQRNDGLILLDEDVRPSFDGTKQRTPSTPLRYISRLVIFHKNPVSALLGSFSPLG